MCKEKYWLNPGLMWINSGKDIHSIIDEKTRISNFIDMWIDVTNKSWIIHIHFEFILISIYGIIIRFESGKFHLPARNPYLTRLLSSGNVFIAFATHFPLIIFGYSLKVGCIIKLKFHLDRQEWYQRAENPIWITLSVISESAQTALRSIHNQFIAFVEVCSFSSDSYSEALDCIWWVDVFNLCVQSAHTPKGIEREKSKEDCDAVLKHFS